MDIFDNMAHGFMLLMGITPILVIVIGVAIGIAVGVLPGLSASTGVALILPFTWVLDPAVAMILLAAVYIAAEYGGSITAITINTPGTPAAVATTFDGYPLAQKGGLGKALSISIFASAFGGIFGTIILIVFAPTLAEVALGFGPAEYVALGVLGLTLAASLSAADYVKGGLATLLGLLLSTVGQDPMTGAFRFTFGTPNLVSGIGLVPALIGLFAASEIFNEVMRSTSIRKTVKNARVKMADNRMLWQLKRVMLQSSVIGTLIGIVPGAGATIGSLVAYNEARRFSRTPEEFGKGAPEGIAAAESANNATVGGALVPLLTLGIPGSGTTAVMMGALMMHGLTPGPELFSQDQNLVYSLFASMLVSNIVMLVMGLAGIGFWLWVMRTPKPYLMTVVLGICVVGSYAVENSLSGVWQMIIFGLIGFFLKRYGFPVATVVLGLVLGFMIETNVRRAVLYDGWGIFLDRPVAAVMLVFAIMSFILAIYKSVRQVRGGVAARGAVGK